jgi:hypothetical protein
MLGMRGDGSALRTPVRVSLAPSLALAGRVDTSGSAYSVKARVMSLGTDTLRACRLAFVADACKDR